MPRKNDGRIGKLVVKLRELNPSPGEQLRVGIAQRDYIVTAAARADVILKSIVNTGEWVPRDDGIQVPVYLLTFE